jgi:hypothetical protein
MTQVFPSDPSQRHHVAYAPGEHFHYSNLCWSVLGFLAWTLDGRELPEILRKRILEPLGMKQTEPVITLDARGRMIKSYSAFQNDRPLARDGRVSEAPAIILTEGDGCVASTARDMGAYVHMITNGGVGPGGRLVSKESFELFSQSHIVAKEFGPTAGYGYGIVVDQLEGSKILRHTGGMISFMSSLFVDLDNGVGAFASINAMLGYRPVPVTEFAVRLMRAQRLNKPLPPVPAPNPVTRVVQATEYAGTYHSTDGRNLTLAAEEETLYLLHQGRRIPLCGVSERDQFVVMHPEFERFLLVFGRHDSKDPKSAVTEVAWGSNWYAGTAYEGPKEFSYPREWDAYLGHYRSESPWIGSVRILARKGQLWADGTIPLEFHGDRFYLRDEEHSPEWITFGEVVNGRCMRIKFSGGDLWRVAAA